MTFEEFKAEIKNNIMAYLPEEYQDYSISIEEINKSGRIYDGLIIKSGKGKYEATPVLNLTSAYEDYKEGIPIDAILTKLAEVRTTATLNAEFSPDDMLNWEKAKLRVLPRIINTQANMKYLADKPCVVLEDLSIMFVVRVQDDGKSLSEGIITDGLQKVWGVSLNALYKQALKNLAKQDVMFTNITSVLVGDKSSINLDTVDPTNYPIPFFILSNKQLTKGASMVLNTKAMNKIVERFGDIYIIPSSVDEVLIAPQKNNNPAELAEMVKAVNGSEVAPEDRLSDNVYEYDKETETIKIVA